MKSSLSRRAFLRTATGAALALPLLPERTAGAATSAPPRVIFWTWPEGAIDASFWPAVPHGASLAKVALPFASSPLEPHRQDLTFVRGLEHRKRGRFEVAHGDANREILTGRRGGGTSLDQVIAAKIAGDAPRRSYELGVSVFGDGNDKLYISQDRAGALRPAQNDPVKAFDDLLAGSAGGEAEERRRKQLALRKSLLDGTKSELEALRCRLGRDGKARVEAHLDGVRSIERTVDRLLELPRGTASGAAIDRALATAHRDRSKHPLLGKAHLDILVAALRSDAVRVAMMQWSHTNDNNLAFPFLDVQYKEASHHALSHEHAGFASVDKAADKPQTRRDRDVVLNFWMKQLAYLIEQLKATRDGTGTLFDSTLIVAFSEHGSNHHRNTDLPFVLIGSGGRRFRTGQALNYKGATHRSHNDLLATILRGYDPAATTFGDPTENEAPLAEILAG